MAILPTAQTIAVLSQKGGTGKTTTVRTLADAFRRVGLDVLVADLDPQGNLSDYYDVPADASPTVAEVLAGSARAVDAVHDGVLPANLGLAEAELVLAGGEKVFDTVVRRSVRYAESAERGVSILDYAPDLGADYVTLADEVLSRLGAYDEARGRLAALAPA
jgi:chromosome partitioning protein